MRARRILLVTLTIMTGAAGLLGPIYAIYVEKLGGHILATSASYAVFGIVYGLSMLVMGKIADRVKEKEYFIVFGFLLSGFAYLGFLFATQPLHLFFIEAVLGLAMSSITPANDALYTKHLDSGKYASEWASWEAVFWITDGVSAFLGGLIVAYISFTALFILMASISFIAGVYILLLPRRIL